MQVSGEIPDASPDCQSIRSSGPLGYGEKRTHSLSSVDPSLPGDLDLFPLLKAFNILRVRHQIIRNRLEILAFYMVAVPVRIVDPSKDLNSYGLGSVDWKERVEGWKLKQEKNIVQMTNKYPDGKGDIEGTGSNGDDLQMYVHPLVALALCSIFIYSYILYFQFTFSFI